MENKQIKCIKGKSCLYCGTTYCQFVDELNELNSFKEQIKFQNNFIDSLLKATNNSEWLDKSILDDEAGEIIEKIELDYVDLDQLKAENESLENQLKSEKERFEKQDKFAAMYIQELKNEKSSLIKKFLEKIGQLQSENEELKKQNNQLDNGINEQFSKIVELEGRNNLLKAILTEIKEIAEEKAKVGDWLALEILQKISEVEDG